VPQIIQRVCLYIEKNLSERLTLSILSKSCYISPNYLSYLFHRETDMTVNDYITVRRMNRACEILSEAGKVYINELAERVGYKDPAYFARQFKKSIGCTPVQYQARAGKKTILPDRDR
jgi:two-component system response regulator YesN